MEIKNIYNINQGILSYINNKIKDNNTIKYLVFSQIDDQTFEMLDKQISSIEKLFICIDRYYTTSQMFKGMLTNTKYKEVLVYANSNIVGNKLNNLIVIMDGESVEVLILPFALTSFNVQNADSYIISIQGTINDLYIKEMLDNYENNKEYMELSEEFIQKCIEDKLFRNDKANNIYKDVNKDEIIQSFRNLGDSENYDETLKVIQKQTAARKFSLDKSELSFTIEETTNSNININEDIIIDIDI